MVEVHTVKNSQDQPVKKLAELSQKYIILEKIGSAGELKILPRTFDDKNLAVSYLAEIDDSIKHSKLLPTHKKKQIEYYVVPATLVEFLV